MIQAIQANITGFTGEPVTLYSAFNSEKGLLTIAKMTALNLTRRDGCLVASNIQNTDFDLFIEEKNLRESIEAFRRLSEGVATDKTTARIIFAPDCKSANPEPMIEVDKLEDTGIKYRLDPNLTNAQVAALSTCLYVARSGAIQVAETYGEMFARLSKETYAHFDFEAFTI